MKTIYFSIAINADKETIWNALWDDANYRDWTSAFTQGSYAITDGWKEGTRVQFLAPSGDGMFSTVAKHIPNQEMSFKHLGIIKNGKEQPADDETKKWSGAMETYTLEHDGNTATLKVSVDMEESYVSMFEKMFPEALGRVKVLAEKNNLEP